MPIDDKNIDVVDVGWQRFDIRPVTCPGYSSVVPQVMRETYGEDEALRRGTVFPELDLPMDKYGIECGK